MIATSPRLHPVIARPLVLVLLLGFLLSGCGAPRGEPWVVTRLYVGLSSPEGPVTAEQFAAFLDQEVTPQFPAGLTVYHADGQWRGKDGAVQREPAMVIEIVHLDSAASAAKLKAIAYLYKKRFRQESVLVIQGHPQVRFE